MSGLPEVSAGQTAAGRSVPAITVDDLLGAVAAGDRRAFDLLYGQFLSPVTRLVRLLIRDVALAEEVTQEVFLAVWLGAGRFDSQRGDGGAWIIGIAKSRAIDRIRSEQAARQRDLSYAAAVGTPPVTPPELVSARLEGRLVRDALSVLTAKQRQAVMLAFFGGHSYQEVSTLLGVPLPTVKSRIRDGLSRLRDHLEAGGHERPAAAPIGRPPFGLAIHGKIRPARLAGALIGAVVLAGE